MDVDALDLLFRANVALSVAAVVTTALSGPARKALGARNAYALWAAPPLAALAALLPARRVSETVMAPAITEAAPLGVEAIGASSAVAAIFPWGTVFLALWAFGAAICLVIMAAQQRRFLKSLEPLEPTLYRSVRIFRTERAGVSPALIGALAPRLVVPADFEHVYNEEERDWVIAHELKHLERGDAVVNALTAFAMCLCWFNPFVYFAAARMREDQEMACDAAVLAEREDARLRYARALIKARLAVEGVTVGCAWPARRPNSLMRRIETLQRGAPSRRCEQAGAVLVGCLAFAGGAAAWSAQPPVVTRTYVAASPAAVAPRPEPAAQPLVLAATRAPADEPAAVAPPVAVAVAVAAAQPAPARPRPSAAPRPRSYIDSLAAVGLKDLTADQLIAMKIHGVDAEMIRAARAMGFDPTPDDLVAMAVAGVTPEYVENVRNSGWKDVTLDELVSMRHMNVDPADAAAFAKLGLDGLDLDDLIGFAALGVTADYVRALKATGVTSRDPDEYAEAAAMGVTPAFVAKARAHGFNDLSLETLAQLKAADVLD